MGTRLIGVHQPKRLILVRPVAVVAGSCTHDDAAFRELIHNPVHKGRAFHRVLMGRDKAGIRRAQRQVHRVAAQNHSILHSGHVVAGVGAAFLTEDLHGDQLRIGSYPRHAHSLGSGDVQGTVLLIALQLLQQQVSVIGRHTTIAAEVGIIGAVNLRALHRMVQKGLGVVPIQLAIPIEIINADVFCGNIVPSRGDASHMGAVFALLVVVVGHIQIAVYVVEGKGQFAVQIQVLCCEIFIPLGRMELVQDTSNLLRVHQVQRSLIRLQTHALLLGLELQRVFPGSAGERLMVCISTGIHHSNPGARTGIPGILLHASSTSHLLGHHVAGICSRHGFIPGLQIHGLDAGYLADFLQLAIGDVGRNGIGRQRQVPDHIQGFPCQTLAGNPAGHLFLGVVQALTILDGSLAGESLARGLHGSQGGVLLQDNHHTDHIGRFIGLGSAHLGGVTLGVHQLSRYLAGIQLLEVQRGGASVHCVSAAQAHAADQGGSQNQGQQALQTGMLHDRSSFLILKYWQAFRPHIGGSSESPGRFVRECRKPEAPGQRQCQSAASGSQPRSWPLWPIR